MSNPVLTESDLFTPDTAAQWNTTLLANADALKLTTSAWQAGGPTRTTFAVVGNVMMLEDVAISLLNQGGFLDFAATGTVVYTDPVTGLLVTAYVTPDPSNPAQNPAGTPGALDVLASSVYNVTRIWASGAGGEMGLLNTSATTYGPFAVGAYHVSQPSAAGSPTYSNTASLTIAPSVAVGGTITGVVAAAGLIKVTTSGAHGRATGDHVAISGVTGVTPLASPTVWIVTVVDATHVTLDGSTFAGAYTGGGVMYTPTVAPFIADALGTASNAATANVITQATTSLIGVVVANFGPFTGTNTESNIALAARCRLKLQSLSPNGPRGAYQFFALSSTTFAPLLSPPQIVGSAITRAFVQTDKTTGTVTTTIANAGGAPTADDRTAVEAVIQAYCVPDAVTSIVQSATNRSVTAAVTIYCPASFSATATAVAQVAIEAYFAIFPIGGITDPGGASNVIPLQGMLGALATALTASNVPYQDLSGTLNGVAANLQLLLVPTPEVAILSATPSVTVVPS